MSDIQIATSSRPLIPGWTSTPIPNFTLSASGLLVLADLSTVAQRTALRGGSSWLDSLLLVPGLHYQQAADELARAEGAAQLVAAEVGVDGQVVTHTIVNRAVVSYILRAAEEGKTVVLKVGELPVRSRSWAARRRDGARGQRGLVYGGGGVEEPVAQELTWAAQLLYLASPVLTCVAIVFVVLLEDWWALGLILALMLSRVLNIAVIKARSQPKPADLPAPFKRPPATSTHPLPPPRATQYTITLNPTTAVILRGLDVDLNALTTTVWLRPKTRAEGYLEAAAKLLAYLVASVSGNATQAGNLVLLVLLLASAGLLALSNARITGLRSGGMLVAPSPGGQGVGEGGGGGVHGGGGGGGGVLESGPSAERGGNMAENGSGSGSGSGVGREKANGAGGRLAGRGRDASDSWPGTSDLSSLSSGIEDSLEKGQGLPGRLVRRTFPSDDSVEYEVQLDTHLGTVEISALRRNHEGDEL